MRTVPRARPAPERRIQTPREIYSYLDQHIVGQEEAKRAVAVAAYNHQRRCQLPPGRKRLLRKSNVLLVGPTGSGKTLIAQKLAECLDLPLSVADATEYTAAGYYGKDVEVMIAELLFRTCQSVEETQRGIIFIDEVDKLARRSPGSRTGAARDIGGEGVQQALLKLLEGREIFVPLNVTQHWNKHDLVPVDTADILFIAAGTFSDLYEERRGGAAGFLSSGAGADPPAGGRRQLSAPELIRYGMLAEFMGRLPVLVNLEPLGEEQLLTILTEPPDALLREYTQLFALDDVTLELRPEALRLLCRRALLSGVGARGLRALFEAVCRDLMFEAPELRGQRVVIDADYVAERLERAALGGAPSGEQG